MTTTKPTKPAKAKKSKTSITLLPLILKKREGGELSAAEIDLWVSSTLGKSQTPDYQQASLLAFCFSKGLSDSEAAALTNAMRFSGDQFDYSKFPRGAFFVDKHSTGGVGDKITLPLAPLTVAADERLYYPTIAGRGLGHTGGTTDKLESIPGMKVSLPMPKFYQVLKKHRLCFLAQTDRIAPADKKLYHLRDATGTVENIGLITASILSKKLSESLNYLLLDVKFGSGAFMRDIDRARALAQSLTRVAGLAGVKTEALITNMDEPLGLYSGHRFEILESIQILKGQGNRRSQDLTQILASKFLKAAGVADADIATRLLHALSSGKAYEVWERVVAAQGGSLKKFEALQKKNFGTKVFEVKATRAGYLSYETRELGLALTDLGGGRQTREDKIDFDVALEHPLPAGSAVQSNQTILRLHYKDAVKLEAARTRLKQTTGLRIGDQPLKLLPLVDSKL